MQEVVTFDSIVHAVMPQFERISRSHNLVEWQKESSFALQSIQKNTLLQKCTTQSIQNSIVNIAAIGLTLNPADGFAYLVPEYNKDISSNECQLRISFKGLVKVATDSGCIKWVKAEIVKENDDFQYKGPCNMPAHTMNPFSDRGKTVGVYCVAKTNDGDYLTDTIDIAELIKIRECAKTKLVWDKWFDEMAKKAVIKRAAKQWPKSDGASRISEAVAVINESEGGTDPFLELESIAAEIIDLIHKDDLLEVGRIWCELDEKEQSYLWTAKTKGGWFTIQEKDLIRKGIAEFNSVEKGE